jgi:hypothetical protein
MKVKNLRVKDPNTDRVLVEIEEVEAPVAELLELLRAGIIEAVKGAINR